MPATNYTATAPSGTTLVGGGINVKNDMGILLIGDSNMCGAGGGTKPVLVNAIWQWDNDTNTITQLNGSSPVFNHTLNSGLNEVGPDTSFCDRYATERGSGYRVVGLPCGDSGSGFSTAQWYDGQQMYELMQQITNEFLASDRRNKIGAVLIVLGANDIGDFTPVSNWSVALDTLIDAIRSTAFVYNDAQQNLSKTPVIVCGTAPEWYVIASNRQDIQTEIEGTPARKTYTGYATTAGLASEAGDLIHLSGAANITLGGTNAWTALLAAEANT
jgi:hypothetical protein